MCGTRCKVQRSSSEKFKCLFGTFSIEIVDAKSQIPSLTDSMMTTHSLTLPSECHVIGLQECASHLYVGPSEQLFRLLLWNLKVLGEQKGLMLYRIHCSSFCAKIWHWVWWAFALFVSLSAPIPPPSPVYYVNVFSLIITFWSLLGVSVYLSSQEWRAFLFILF